MDFWLNGLVFVLTYLVFGAILAASFRKCVSTPRTQLAATTILIVGLGVAPWLTASLLSFQFRLLPQSHPLVSVLFVFAFYVFLAIWSRKQFRPFQNDLQARFRTILTEIRALSIDWKIGLALCVLIMTYILYQSMAFPIASHDGSVYAFLGDYLRHAGSLANYPMVLPDVRTGARFTLEHPPGLPLLYAWFHLFSPDGPSVLPRSVSAICSLYVVLLLFDVLAVRRHLPAAVTGTLVMLLVPAFVWQSFDNSIDPPRLFLFLASLVLLSQAFEEQKWTFALCAGLCAGFAAFVHVSGVLTVLVGVAMIVLNQWRSPRRLLQFGLIFAAAAALIGAGYYVNNLMTFGNILGPKGQSLFTVSVGNFYSQTELAHRNQASELGRLIFGRLQIFSRPELFGAAFWLLLISLGLWKRLPEKRLLDRVLLVGLALFAAPVLYKYYSNRRYILTILPCVAYIDGLVLADVYMRLRAKRVLMWAVGIVGVGVIAGSALLPSSILANKLGVGTNPLRFMTASKAEQNRAIDGGLDEAIQFVNAHTLENSVILTSDERFFIRARRKGVMWGGINPLLELYQKSWLRHQPKTVARLIDERGIDYLLIDHANLAVVSGSTLGMLLKNETYCTLVHDAETKVWKWKDAAARRKQRDDR